MRKIVIFLSLFYISLYSGVIEDIKSSNKIRIGIKYDTKPFGFKEGKRIKGFDLELSKLIINEIKIKYNLPMLKHFYKKVIPDNREEKLLSREVDMVIATYTISDKRKEKIAFSKPYFKDTVVIIYKDKIDKSPIGVLKNSTIKDSVAEMGYATKEYLTYKELYQDFDTNKISAISSNKMILNDYIKSAKYSNINTSMAEEYAIGLPKNDPEFKRLIDDILDTLKKNGEYDKLYKKWFD